MLMLINIANGESWDLTEMTSEKALAELDKIESPQLILEDIVVACNRALGLVVALDRLDLTVARATINSPVLLTHMLRLAIDDAYDTSPDRWEEINRFFSHGDGNGPFKVHFIP